jgi:hypothetical protein
MKFRIIKTSFYGDNEKPHPDAYQEEFINSYGNKQIIFCIDIENIYEFCKKLREKIVVFPLAKGDKYSVIEIYDTWRE